MFLSSERRQALIGWCHKNAKFILINQIQAFLIFYEYFTAIDNGVYELNNLDDVYYTDGNLALLNVRHDHKLNKKLFKAACEQAYENNSQNINAARAKLSAYLTRTLHRDLAWFLNTCSITTSKTMSFKDCNIFYNIQQGCPTEVIDTFDVLTVYQKAFIYLKTDAPKLDNPDVKNALLDVSFDRSFRGPTYIRFNQKGEMALSRSRFRQLYVLSKPILDADNIYRPRLIGILTEIKPGNNLPGEYGEYEFAYKIGGKFHEWFLHLLYSDFDRQKAYNFDNPSGIYKNEKLGCFVTARLFDGDKKHKENWLNTFGLTDCDEWGVLTAPVSYPHAKAYFFDKLPRNIILYEEIPDAKYSDMIMTFSDAVKYPQIVLKKV